MKKGYLPNRHKKAQGVEPASLCPSAPRCARGRGRAGSMAQPSILRETDGWAQPANPAPEPRACPSSSIGPSPDDVGEGRSLLRRRKASAFTQMWDEARIRRGSGSPSVMGLTRSRVRPGCHRSSGSGVPATHEGRSAGGIGGGRRDPRACRSAGVGRAGGGSFGGPVLGGKALQNLSQSFYPGIGLDRLDNPGLSSNPD